MKRRQAAHNNVAPVRKRFAILGLAGLLSLLLAGTVVAASGSGPVADCYTNQRLTREYTAAELRSALAHMPADVREYSNCYNVIQQALLQKIGGLHGGGDSGGGGSFLPTWLIVVLAALVLAGAGFGVVAVRNRGQGA